jgi:hypothetical protein
MHDRGTKQPASTASKRNATHGLIVDSSTNLNRGEETMAPHDTPVKTPTPVDEQRERFEWSGERRFKAERPVLDKIDARQGVTGHNVRYVLLFGLVAVIIAFAAILAFDFYR